MHAKTRATDASLFHEMCFTKQAKSVTKKYHYTKTTRHTQRTGIPALKTKTNS